MTWVLFTALIARIRGDDHQARALDHAPQEIPAVHIPTGTVGFEP